MRQWAAFQRGRSGRPGGMDASPAVMALEASIRPHQHDIESREWAPANGTFFVHCVPPYEPQAPLSNLRVPARMNQRLLANPFSVHVNSADNLRHGKGLLDDEVEAGFAGRLGKVHIRLGGD